MKTPMKPTDQTIELSKIEIVSNTRKSFDANEINELAISIKNNGLLQPIGVIKTDKNKYRIIFGERRFRACLLNKSNSITCKVFEGLTDLQILELQIIENLQRKDIHPMEEAKAFNLIIDTQKLSFKEIGLKVGKSPSFVAQRLKLNDLIEQFQTAFRANRFNISTALEISVLSVDSQILLWEEECQNLEDDEPIEISNRDLNTYRLNLNNADFDIKDKSLVPNVGACSNCQFNSACQKLLFPEEAKNSYCTNAPCFHNKTKTSFNVSLQKALIEPGTQLISTAYRFGDDFTKELIEQGNVILQREEFEELETPEEPNLNTYKERLEEGDYDDEEEMLDDYKRDLKDYKTDLEHINDLKEANKIKKGFVVSGNNKGSVINFVLIDRSIKSSVSTLKPTAKELQEKIKAETVTADDYLAEINRLNAVEVRKKEMDEEKTQPFFYEALKDDVLFNNSSEKLENQELSSLIILLIEFGGYSLRNLTSSFINDELSHIDLLNSLNALSETELQKIFNRLVRAIMVVKLRPNNGDKPSKNVKALALLNVANCFVSNKVESIWNAQLVERQQRENALAEKVLMLERKINQSSQIQKVA